MQKEKTIFITGATGFVGSNLAYELLKRGYQLKLLVRGQNPEKKINDSLGQLYSQQKDYDKAKKEVEIINGDITKGNLGISVQDANRLSCAVTTVFHCAASVSFDESEKDTIEKQNIEGVKNLLEFMRKLNLRELHYISTAYVAGQRTGIVYEEELDEGQSFNNTYEESKFKAEKLVKSHENIKTTIYRPSIIIGNSETGKTSSFWGLYSLAKSLYLLIQIFKEDFKRGGERAKLAGAYYKDNLLHIPLRVGGMEEKTLNLVPIDYVINVIMQIFNSENNYNKTYHITNPNPPTIEYVQRLVCESLGISGVEIVDLLSNQINSMNRWEEFFAQSIRNFAPYLQNKEPVFSNKNTFEALSGTDIKCPLITKDLISKLISYCIDTDWGKKINESLLNTSTSH